MLILEDDPYFYLQFAPGGGAPRGLSDLGASYLSMDADGRVIRLDSFAKVGHFLGWVRSKVLRTEHVRRDCKEAKSGAPPCTASGFQETS